MIYFISKFARHLTDINLHECRYTQEIAMQLSVKHNIKDVLKDIKHDKRQVPFAVAGALNNTAFITRRAEQAAMRRYLDRPTKWTQSGVRVDKANKRRLMAAIYIERQRAEYLYYQVEGGTQHFPKGHPVPGRKQQLNQYGNLTRRATKIKAAYNKRVGKMRGVWKHVGGKKNGRPQLIAHFVDDATYEAKYPFHRIARGVAERRFKSELAKSMRRAMRTAR